MSIVDGGGKPNLIIDIIMFLFLVGLLIFGILIICNLT